MNSSIARDSWKRRLIPVFVRPAACAVLLGLALASLARAQVMWELEPNDPPAAMGIVPETGTAIWGRIDSPGDTDLYLFVPPLPGSLLYAYVDTGGPQEEGATNRNLTLTLAGPVPGVVIQTDFDDGTGNGGDGTIESPDAPALAGVPLGLPPGTPYYLRVTAADGSSLVRPYRLFAQVVSPPFLAEIEPNDAPVDATPLPPGANMLGALALALGDPVDCYEVAVTPFTALYVGLNVAPVLPPAPPNDLQVILVGPDMISEWGYAVDSCGF
jgi:hypothetical protein